MYTRSRNHERDNLGAEADDPKECAEGNKTDRPSLAERAAVANDEDVKKGGKLRGWRKTWVTEGRARRRPGSRATTGQMPLAKTQTQNAGNGP